jgi:hypothetical protein
MVSDVRQNAALPNRDQLANLRRAERIVATICGRTGCDDPQDDVGQLLLNSIARRPRTFSS